RHEGLSIRCSFGTAREGNSRVRDHRLDEPTKLSLGMVASLQSPLPFYLARSLYLQSRGIRCVFLRDVRGLLTPQLPCLASSLQFEIALSMDLLLLALQHIFRRHVSDGAMQTHGVVVIDILPDQSAGGLSRKRGRRTDVFGVVRL